MRGRAVFALVLAIAGGGSGRAHEVWADGTVVPEWIKSVCCGAAEAHHLTPEMVHRVDDGHYTVDGYRRRIPVWVAQPSLDGDYWIFYRDWGEDGQSPVICFFVPLNF